MNKFNTGRNYGLPQVIEWKVCDLNEVPEWLTPRDYTFFNDSVRGIKGYIPYKCDMDCQVLHHYDKGEYF